MRVLQRRLRELGQWPVAATALGVWAPALGVAASALELPRRRAAARWDTQPNPGARPFVAAENGGGIPVQAIGYVSSAAGRAPTRRAVSGQIAAIDEACRLRGWELTEIVSDVAPPTGPANGRGLAYALERVAAERPVCLVVAELTRLGESAAELGQIVQSLRDRGIGLVAVDADLDLWTKEGRLAAEALSSVIQADRGTRTRLAVRELPALRKHIVAMRESGMTLQAIADRLNAEGVPTLRGGKRWRPSSVQVALGYRRPGQTRVADSLPRGQFRLGRARR